MDNNFGFKYMVVLLVLVLCIVFFSSLLIGSTRLDIRNILVPGSVDSIIFLSIRLPRTVAAILAGIAFSLSGLLVQSASGNDLASPNIIGMNSGAGFAVLIFLSFFPHLFGLLPLVAFIGGIAAVSLVFLISSLVGRYDSSGSLILAGIAVNALFNAFISALSSLIPDVLSSYSAFSIGGFSSIQSSQLYVPGAVIIITASACFFIAEQMNILKLGDEIASSMGYCPRYIRIVLVALSALLASSAVTFSGLLGFVGLVTPHLASLLSGGESRKTMVMTIISGPLLVLLADLLSRTIIMPSELPAGVFMAIIGVPFFIFLLIRRARRW